MKFPSPEFDDAVAALCHGTIGEQSLAELHGLLLADSGARDEYLWRVEVHGELAWGKLQLGKLSESDRFDGKSGALTMPAHPGVPTRRRRDSAPMVAAALLIGVILGGGLWMWNESQTAPAVPVKPQIVARFGELQDCRWVVSDTRVQSGDAIEIGQRIELSAGSAEVLFNTGAKLTIVGPAVVEPRTDNGVFLMMGEVQLVAETPESKGFTVVTPTSKFVDVSTAFTARVSPDGLSHLEVSEGEVDAVLDGTADAQRLKAGQALFVEPGEQKVTTLIESGDGTAAFRFPTISPPSSEDYADQQLGLAKIRVAGGELKRKPGNSGPAEILLDGTGQSRQDAPHQSAFFREGSSGSFLIDLGQAVSISKINTYSWHQHYIDPTHRHRATQRFTLYGYAGDELPDLTLPPRKAGWTRIARVNSDRFFEVAEPLERPAQQACSIASARGEIGRFRYLLWVTKGATFFGEFDVFGSPESETDGLDEEK